MIFFTKRKQKKLSQWPAHLGGVSLVENQIVDPEITVHHLGLRDHRPRLVFRQPLDQLVHGFNFTCLAGLVLPGNPRQVWSLMHEFTGKNGLSKKFV